LDLVDLEDLAALEEAAAVRLVAGALQDAGNKL
jgi:hypothetical protein